MVLQRLLQSPAKAVRFYDLSQLTLLFPADRHQPTRPQPNINHTRENGAQGIILTLKNGV